MNERQSKLAEEINRKHDEVRRNAASGFGSPAVRRDTTFTPSPMTQPVFPERRKPPVVRVSDSQGNRG